MDNTIPYTLLATTEGTGMWIAFLRCDECGATVCEDAYASYHHPAVDLHTQWHENQRRAER